MFVVISCNYLSCQKSRRWFALQTRVLRLNSSNVETLITSRHQEPLAPGLGLTRIKVLYKTNLSQRASTHSSTSVWALHKRNSLSCSSLHDTFYRVTKNGNSLVFSFRLLNNIQGYFKHINLKSYYRVAGYVKCLPITIFILEK